MLLNCHTYFSLRYGAMSPEELLRAIHEKGYNSFVLSDINNTSACIETIRLATDKKEFNIHTVLGIDFRNGITQQYIGIAKNNHGFKELNEHLTHHLHTGKKIQNQAPEFNHCFVVYPFVKNEFRVLRDYEFIGIRHEQLKQLPFSVWRNKRDKLVILQPATFRNKRDFNAHRLLRAIDLNTLLSKLPVSEQTSPDDLLLSKDELYFCFREYPEIIRNTEQILENCSIDFELRTNKNKQVFFNSRAEDYTRLKSLCNEGVAYRYKKINKEIEDRIKKELTIISDYNYCSYFLINWDMINYARHKGYYHVGRGSGANSLVAYLLRITDVDPIELDLYFERFINPHRKHPPDFDIDFSWTDRDDITNYLFKTHGFDCVSLLGAYNTFQSAAVTREIGKVFGLPADEISQIQKTNWNSLDQTGKLILKYSTFIHKFPSHLSVHSSGILIANKPTTNYSATFIPPKGYPTTQFDMHAAEDVGLYKFDILSQRGLGKIKDGLQIIKQNRGIEIDIQQVEKFKKDEKVKDLLRQGKTIGCFYVESPAMRMLLTKLNADDYLRLVAASSIIRPGVAKSGMMREYILRYRDVARRKKAMKDLPKLYQLMDETYGVMVYQEDVIKVAHLFADLDLADADIIRRGMSWKFKERNEFHVVKEKFFKNCEKKGHDKLVVTEIWRQIETFANFAFSKGHSASYAVESYQALYLKAHYPLEYMVATINNGGGFYKQELYFHEARMNGASIELPCINKSNILTSISDKTIHIGFHLLQSLEVKTIQSILNEREKNGIFKTLQDFLKRIPIELEQVRLLIRVGAFRFCGRTKKELLWDLHFFMNKTRKTNPVKELFDMEVKAFELPKLDYHENENAFDEIELLGFPLCSPFDLTEQLSNTKLRASDLIKSIGKSIIIQGYLVHVKTTITSSGGRMHFGVFLDMDGYWIDTVHFPPVAKIFPFQGPGCYEIKGKVTEEFEYISIEVNELKRLSYSNTRNSVRLKPVDNYTRLSISPSLQD